MSRCELLPEKKKEKYFERRISRRCDDGALYKRNCIYRLEMRMMESITSKASEPRGCIIILGNGKGRRVV